MKKLVAVLLLMSLLFTLSGCFSDTEIEDGPLCYSQLSGKEKKLYDTINEAVLNYETDISNGLGNFKFRDFDRVFQGVLSDHPEYFWLSGSYSYYSGDILGGDRVTRFLPEYAVDTALIDGYKTTLSDYASMVVSNAFRYSNAYDKIVYIHDLIVGQTTYNDDGDLKNSTAYGVLIGRKGICSGYAKAFQYLVNALGFDCYYVTGEVAGGEQHAWNIVSIEGENFFVDATFDDPLYTGANNLGADVFYNYFGLSEDKLDKTHSIFDIYDYPKCETEEYFYYKKSGNYIEGGNVSKAESLIKSAYSNGKAQATIKFSDMSSLNSVVSSLFDGKRIFQVIPGKTSITYGIDQTNCILVVKIR